MAENEKTPERFPESAQLDEAAIRRLQDDLPDDEPTTINIHLCYKQFATFCLTFVFLFPVSNSRAQQFFISALYSQIPIISVIHNLLAKIAVP